MIQRQALLKRASARAVVLLAAVLLAAMWARAQGVPRLAPAFELQLFNGKLFRLADYRGKQAVLLWFWAPW